MLWVEPAGLVVLQVPFSIQNVSYLPKSTMSLFVAKKEDLRLEPEGRGKHKYPVSDKRIRYWVRRDLATTISRTSAALMPSSLALNLIRRLLQERLQTITKMRWRTLKRRVSQQ